MLSKNIKGKKHIVDPTAWQLSVWETMLKIEKVIVNLVKYETLASEDRKNTWCILYNVEYNA